MDDITQLLQIEGVSTVGILLTGFFLLLLSLWKEWMITGKRWQAKVADCDDLKVALTAAQTELKAVAHDYTETRIELARIEERERLHDGTEPRRRSRT